MLTLHYNGYDIPTGKDFSVKFSWKNPACYFSDIPGAAGLDIEIPVNDYSKAIFGHPHRFAKYATGSDRKFNDFEVRFNGVLLMCGTLNITEATEEKYSGWLQSKIGSVGEEQREKYINEMKTDSEVSPWSSFDNQLFENKGDFDPDVDNYCTGEHINKSFWEEIGRKITTIETYTNDEGEEQEKKVELSWLSSMHKTNFDYLVNKTSGGIAIITGEGCVVSAFLFLQFLLKEIFKRCQLFIDDSRNAFENELTEFKMLALYNNYNLLEPNPVTGEDEIYQINPITGVEELKVINVVSSFNWELGDQGGFDFVHLIPHISLKDFLLGLQNFLNIAFLFIDNKVCIIDRLSIFDGVAFDVDKYIVDSWIIGQKKDITLKMTSNYDDNDSLISDNFHDLSERISDFGEDVDEESDLADIGDPSYGEIRHVLTTDSFFEYKWDTEATYNELGIPHEFDHVDWVFVSSGPQPKLYGTGDESEKIETDFYAPYTLWNQSKISKMQQGVISTTRNLWNNFSPCLFFHTGGNGISTRDSSAKYSLLWDGDVGMLKNGLFKTRWEKWASFWCSRLPVEAYFDFPLNVLYYIVNNIISKFQTKDGEFIIEEMEVTISIDSIGKTYIKGYKL